MPATTPRSAAIIFTGAGDEAFCSGGDQRSAATPATSGREVAKRASGGFHVTDLQVQMRRLPKPVVAMVAGYAIGGGHILHLCLRPDDRRRQRRLRPDRAAGRLLRRRLRRLAAARPSATKKAKEIWLLCRQYDAEEALEMGLVNTVVPLGELERETVAWCREMLALSPFALRLVKASFNAHEDG